MLPFTQPGSISWLKLRRSLYFFAQICGEKVGHRRMAQSDRALWTSLSEKRTRNRPLVLISFVYFSGEGADYNPFHNPRLSDWLRDCYNGNLKAVQAHLVRTVTIRFRACPANFRESGSWLEVLPRGEFQTSYTNDKLKLDNDNPKLCSHKSRFLAILDLTQIPKFSHMLTQILTCMSTFLI